MRITDLLWLALTSLWQRPLRTTLAMLGVVIGTFVLVTTLAIGQGVQAVILEQLRQQDQLRRVFVWPSGGVQEKHIPPAELEVTGDMSDARRTRLREAIIRRWRRPATPVPVGLTERDIQRIQELPHVSSVTPGLSWPGKAILEGKAEQGLIVTASPDDRGLPSRVVAGSFFPRHEEDGVLINEYLAYRWGFRNESEVASLLGRTVRLEVKPPRVSGAVQLWSLLNPTGQDLSEPQRLLLGRLAGKLPEVMAKMDMTDEERKLLAEITTGADDGKPLIALEQPIRGIFRDVQSHELSPWDGPIRGVDIWVSPHLAKKMHAAQEARSVRSGFAAVTVRVDDERNLKAVHKAIAEKGMECFSLAELVDQVRLYTLLISIGCTLIALVALTVAGLGITNTMLMSVLQRTHEIGVMKAVGARDGQVLLLFLFEGLLLGMVGAGLGLIGAFLASYPGDAFAKYLVESQSPMRLERSVFEYPAWLVVLVPIGVVVWTTLAAASPARRAARIDPVEALRAR